MNPLPDEPLLYFIGTDKDLCELSARYVSQRLQDILGPLKKSGWGKKLGHPSTWRLLPKEAVEFPPPEVWLEDLSVYLGAADDNFSSHSFTDPAWGRVLSEELLMHVSSDAPSWALNEASEHPEGEDAGVDGDEESFGAVTFRVAELGARLAMFYAHQKSQLQAPTRHIREGMAALQRLKAAKCKLQEVVARGQAEMSSPAGSAIAPPAPST